MQLIDQYGPVFNYLDEAISIVDRQRRIVFWNKSAERISGYAYDEVAGKHCFDHPLMSMDETGKRPCLTDCPLCGRMMDGQECEIPVFLLHKAGYRVPVTVRIVPIMEENKIVGAAEVWQAEQDQMNKLCGCYDVRQLQALAQTDQLTSLPNRRCMETFLRHKIGETRATKTSFGILFFDIDRFKVFNDRYGHNAGDEMLRLFAKALQNNLRGSDLVGRWGGDEFLGVFACPDRVGLKKVAEKVGATAQGIDIAINGGKASITISTGATMFQKEDTIESMLKRADKLMYQSKRNGRNQIMVG